MNSWMEMFWRGDSAAGMPEPETVLLAMLLSFCLGHIVAWIYMWTHTGLSYSRVFVGSLVGIPVIVSLLMLLMAGNIYIAFGLLAVFAVVRFRNVLKDTRDTTFILWVMVLGMAVGTTRFSTALLGCVFVSAIFLYLRLVSFGSRHHYDVILSLHWTGPGDAARLLRPLLRRHSARVELASQRSATDAGTEMSYRLLLRDPSRSSEVLSEVQATDGVADASLYVREDESEL